MLRLLTPEHARRLRSWFEAMDYTEPGLRRQMGGLELPSRQLRNRARLLDRTAEPSPLNILLRWFWLDQAQSRSRTEGLIPPEILALLLESELLRTQGDRLAPAAMLTPFDGFLIASDPPRAIADRDAAMVLWPNPTSRFLTRFAIRRHAGATLDLGTGTGILSLAAAAFSDSVFATDLNERAVLCARFNLRFNGVENAEVRAGDLFAPVADRRFDLILANPPFFIAPRADYMFCNNAMDLDGLCRRLVREAPQHLTEGGYLQMLCEFAQVRDQPWEQRLAEWLQGAGCDAWVMKGASQHAEDYAQGRIREMSEDSSQDDENYAHYMRYYRERGVEAIHSGLIVMRRRDARNWIRIEEVAESPSGNLGAMVLDYFAAQDLLQTHAADEQLLGLRVSLAPGVRLEQTSRPHDGRWQSDALSLLQTTGFRARLPVQAGVASLLAWCDGRRTVAAAIEQFAAEAHLAPETLRPECLAMIRKLIGNGFMVASAAGSAIAPVTD